MAMPDVETFDCEPAENMGDIVVERRRAVREAASKLLRGDLINFCEDAPYLSNFCEDAPHLSRDIALTIRHVAQRGSCPSSMRPACHSNRCTFTKS
jgi:hypothetical protein